MASVLFASESTTDSRVVFLSLNNVVIIIIIIIIITTTTTITGECKNKMDEDQIVKREAYLLKHLLSHPKVNKNTLKELLLRLVYVEMLDHDASFGQIYAVKATHETDLGVKRQRI